MKKLNRKRLRSILLKEIQNINEQDQSFVEANEAMQNLYKELGPIVNQGVLAISPIGFAITYLNHKTAIDTAYESDGAQGAAQEFLKHHQQLIRDIGQPAIDAAEKMHKAYTK